MGRPDIVHNTLLQILETPLNWEGHLRTFVHTQDDFVISINPKIRLPKNYVRFVGLVEQLLKEGRVPETGEPLLSLEKMSLPRLVADCNPSRTLGFSVLGRPRLLRDVADQASRQNEPMVLIGGFPRGHFTDGTRKLATELVKVDEHPLDAWVVAGRFVYDFEWSIGLARNRVK
jgi:rRNA small subunit pseudouridine methyltransferase Nep1